MPTWDELFKDKANILTYPQTEVMKFAERLESVFNERPLRIWDFCCGAGRNSLAMTLGGHEVYASDVSPTGINILRSQINNKDLVCRTAVCDMTEDPWGRNDFHGIICWDALHHNTIANIRKAIDIIHNSLIPEGQFMATLLSVHSGSHARGEKIEPNTYIEINEPESGVPHHYFDEKEIRDVFKKFKICILAEIKANYIETEFEFYKINPFPYTKWNVLLKKLL